MTRSAEPAPSVGRRLLGLLLLPLAVLLGIGLFIDYVSGSAQIRAAYDHALYDSGLTIAASLRDADRNGHVDTELPAQAIANLRADTQDSVYYSVRDANGALLLGDPDLPAGRAAREDVDFDDAVFKGNRIRVARFATRVDSQPVTITIAETTHKRAAAIRSILSSILLTDVVQLAGTLLLVWLGVRYGVRPLRALGRQIAQRSARDLAPLDRAQVPAEVRPLVHTLNALFETVRDAARAQQQFIADAAHQLRTPLSGIIAQLELLAREAPDPTQRDRMFALREGMLRLAHTSNQLLALARSERSATTSDDFDDVDLRALVVDAVAQQLDRSIALQIDLGAEPLAASARGSEWLLRELLANLLDNALNYTPPGGRVTVRSGVRGARAFLEVEDDGPGIPAESRMHVRERFRRLPGARGDGCGLGLAIVDEIAQAHDAQFLIEDGSGGRGTRARIELRPG